MSEMSDIDLEWAASGLNQKQLLGRRFRLRNLESDNPNYPNLKLRLDVVPAELFTGSSNVEIFFARIVGRGWRTTCDNAATRWQFMADDGTTQGFARFTGVLGRMEASVSIYLPNVVPKLIRLADSADLPCSTMLFNRLVDLGRENWIF